MYSTVAEVGTDQLSYEILEDVGELEVWINITSGQKAPGQECEIEVETADGTAEGKLQFHFKILVINNAYYSSQ